MSPEGDATEIPTCSPVEESLRRVTHKHPKNHTIKTGSSPGLGGAGGGGDIQGQKRNYSAPCARPNDANTDP